MTNQSKSIRAGVTLMLLAATMAGCAGTGTATKTTMAPAPAAAAPTASLLTGKVVETANAGGYTYICLEKDGKRTWIAGPVMQVTVGQELKMLPGATMTGFTSKALNRTFESIIFSGGEYKEPAGKLKDANGVVYQESAEPILVGKVVETMSASNYTYICLEKDGKIAWSAVPSANVAVGDEVEMQLGTVMGQFTSKSLNRTFKEIYFASGVKTIKSAGKAAPAAGAAAATAQPAAASAAAPAAAPALPAGHPKIDAAAQPMAPAVEPAVQGITGKVVETVDAGGYTYICLEKEGKKTWFAVPPTRATVGEELTLAPGITMSKFVARSLNRTFDSIIFSNGVQK
jgi:hypothetical protein